MSSGGKEVVIHSRERPISTDIVRMQSFVRTDVAEYLRFALDASNGSDDFDAGAVTTEFLTRDAPMRAEIVNGLLVRPQTGGQGIAVDRGLLLCVDPDSPANPDESVYKYVRDAGLALAAGIVVASNSSGSPRIDVIECQRQSITVESDNRDRFDPPTSAMLPSTISKAIQSILVYRVRQGTPGAGYPDPEVGWLPLCIASVPDGSTTNDTVTFWDVRPLVADRAFGSANVELSNPWARRALLAPLSSASAIYAGTFEAVLGSRRVGGRLRRGTPGTDAQSIDLSDPDNWDSTVAGLSDGHMVTLWLATPFGLPRWARYSTGTTRLPRSPRGIPILSAQSSDSVNGVVAAPFAPRLPASMGFGSTVAVLDAVAVASFFWNSGGQPYAAPGSNVATYAQGSVDVGAVLTTRLATYALIPGTHFPRTAREIFVKVNASLSIGSPPGQSVSGFSISFPNAPSDVAYEEFRDIYVDTPTLQLDLYVWLPIATHYPGIGATYTVKHALSVATDDFTGTNFLQVIGWR